MVPTRACTVRLMVVVGLVGAILAMSATPAFAVGSGLVRVEKNGATIFTVQGKDADFPVVNDLFRRWDDVKRDAEAKLTAQLTPALSQQLAGKANLTGLRVDIWDTNLELAFTGTGGGNIALDVTLPIVQVVASAHKSGFDGEVWLWFGPLKARTTYNVFTGVIGGINVTSIPTRSETFVSSSSILTDLLDVLTLGLASDLAQDFVEGLVEKSLANTTAQLVPALAAISVQAVGLNSVLPDITYQGVDVDQLVRDAIAGAIQGPLISIRTWGGKVEDGSGRYGDSLTINLWGEYVLRVQHTSPGDRPIGGGRK